MSERGFEEGLHPVAVVMTTDDARAGRSEREWRAMRAPAEYRARWSEILAAPPSRERSELIRRGYRSSYRAFGRRDWELNTALMHPTDYVFKAGGLRQIIPGVEEEARGPEGYLTAHQTFLEAWTEMSVELDDVAEAPDGRTVGLPRFEVRGGASGMEISQPFADVHTWRDGWLVEQVYWWDRDAGLRFAGVDPAVVGVPSER